MKRIITLTLLCTTFFLHLQAQNMEIVDFKLLENDMTAQMHESEKYDQNGDRAALIKIVTSERDFTFDPGSLGIVETEYHTGEIWLYVPRQSKKLTIKHQDYGVTRDYFYPVEIQGGRTYEMLIDLGIGRYVTVAAQIAGSTIYIDDKNYGEESLKPIYLSYGPHKVRAQKDRYEGEVNFVITVNDEKRIRVVNIPQRDMSDHFGDVTVTVDNRADIFYNGQNMGSGLWKAQLREGNYTIETRKANSDPAMTSFTVVAQRQNNVKANAPVPHTGWLHVYTRPRNVKITPMDVSETQTLAVGTYQLEFTRKGFVTQNKEYTIRRNVTTLDTVTLQRVTYVKPLAFYFGGGYTLRSLSGVSALVGAVYQRHDLQVSYTFGLTESGVIFWGGDMNTGTKYKMNSIGVKYGYQFPLMRQLAITPQLGWNYNFLSANAAQSGNTTSGDGALSQALNVGAKLVLVPIQNLYVFVAPEYMFALFKNNDFTTIDNAGVVSGDGFAVHTGVLVNF